MKNEPTTATLPETKATTEPVNTATVDPVASTASTTPIAPAAAPVTTQAPAAAPAQPAKKSPVLWIVLGCVGIILLICCSLIGLAVFAPAILFSAIGSTTTTTRDNTLQRIDSKDLPGIENELTQKSKDIKGVPGQPKTIVLTEKEVLFLITNKLSKKQGFDVSSVGVDIEPGVAKVQFSGKELAKLDSAKTAQIPDAVKNLQPTITITTDATGKTLMISKFSVGNPLIDSFLTADMLKQVNQDLTLESLSNQLGSDIQSVKFQKDQVELVVIDRPADTGSPTPAPLED
jgi:hypothetical protein